MVVHRKRSECVASTIFVQICIFEIILSLGEPYCLLAKATYFLGRGSRRRNVFCNSFMDIIKFAIKARSVHPLHRLPSSSTPSTLAGIGCDVLLVAFWLAAAREYGVMVKTHFGRISVLNDKSNIKNLQE